MTGKYVLKPEAAANTPKGLQDNPKVEYGSDQMAALIGGMDLDYVFMNPGSSFRGLHDSLVNFTANSQPQLVLTTHEGIAVSMAHGYAKAAGKLSGCILHNLVGLMQGTMGIFNAWADRVPILVLGGSGPADPDERRFIDWAHSANTQGDLVRPFTKWIDEPVTLRATFESILRARKVALTTPQGPTYVSVDSVLQESTPASDADFDSARHVGFEPASPPAPDPATLREAAQALVDAKQPLIFGGRFGLDAEITAPLRELVELLGAAYRDDRNIVCMPTTHLQNLNGDTEIHIEADVTLLFECQDIANLIGGYQTQRTRIQGATGGVAASKLINVSMEDYVHASWSRFGGPVAPVDIALNADPKQTLHALLREVRAMVADNADFAEVAKARRKALAERHDALRDKRIAGAYERWDSQPISLARFNHEVYQAVKDEPWLMTVRNHRSHADGFWEYPGAGHYLGGDGGGGVGYGPGAAVGAALAVKGQGKLPVAIIGDGDFLMSSGALWTAVHLRVPLLIVIIDNRSWGNDEYHQIELADQRGRPRENAHIGLHMRDPDIDLLSIAKSYGAVTGEVVERPEDLGSAVTQAIEAVKQGNVAVVHAITSI